MLCLRARSTSAVVFFPARRIFHIFVAALACGCFDEEVVSGNSLPVANGWAMM